MQIPEVMRKCVAFLYRSRDGDLHPVGTAFFCARVVPRHEGHQVRFMVTAQHVIAAARLDGDDGHVHIRLNKQDGSALWVHSELDEWLQPEPMTDCAVLRWRPPPELAVDYMAWLLSDDGVGTPEVMAAEEIGIGDEIFTVGLFRNHLGRDRNEPIVRVGNIAAIPADPIKSRHYGNMPAILVEARSIGGLSGSPVFVHMGFTRFRDGQVQHWSPGPSETPIPFLFLGVMHGHWEVEAADSADATDGTDREKLHTGVGIVVPAKEIMTVVRAVIDPITEAHAAGLDRDAESAAAQQAPSS